MDRLQLLILAVCLSIGVVCVVGCDDSVPQASNGGGGKANVVALKSTKGKKAVKAIRLKHEKIVEELVNLASQNVPSTSSRSTEDPNYIRHQAKHLAIILLGDIHAPDAVPVLLQNLEYINPNILRFGGYGEVGDHYIAAEALSKIGIPAVGPTIGKLADYEPNSMGSKICKWILREILGIELARLRLQLAIKEARDPTVKKNLTAALPYFKTDKEKAAEEYARRKKATG